MSSLEAHLDQRRTTWSRRPQSAPSGRDAAQRRRCCRTRRRYAAWPQL